MIEGTCKNVDEERRAAYSVSPQEGKTEASFIFRDGKWVICSQQMKLLLYRGDCSLLSHGTVQAAAIFVF